MHGSDSQESITFDISKVGIFGRSAANEHCCGYDE